MQDEDGKIEEEVAAEPEVEAIEPQPEQVGEPPVDTPEPKPVAEEVPVVETPPTAAEPEIVTELEAAPPVAPETPPVVVTPPEPSKPEPTLVEPPKPPEPTPVEPAKPEPLPDPPNNKDGIPQKVLDLTPEELAAATRLWASRTIHDAQAKSVHVRRVAYERQLEEVVKFVKANAPVSVADIALKFGLTRKSVYNYTTSLLKQGRIKGEGQTSRRVFS
jgi:hypothetical protein